MPVCIVGMHRSGTSLVARLLNLCGVYLGSEGDLPQPAPDNPGGFWEHPDFVEINEALLGLLQGGWDLPPAAPPGWERAPALRPWRERAAELIARLAPHEPWGWKDPRNSLTLPFWQALVPDLKVVVCLRNPLEVTQSLQRRNRTSRALGLRLWLAYTQTAMQAAGAADRVVTHYASYFSDPRAELRRVLDRLGLPADPAVIDRACRSAPLPLRHFHATTEELLESGAPPDVIHLYLQACAEAGFATPATAPPPASTADHGRAAAQDLPLVDLRAARLEADAAALRKTLDEMYVSERWRFAKAVWPVVGPLWLRSIGAYRALRGRARGLAAARTRRRTLAALDRPGKYDVIILPIIDWRYRFQRPQQLARQYARRGHRCFYAQTTFHAFGPWAALECLEPNVYGLHLPGPPSLDLYRERLDEQALELCLTALDDLRRQAGIIEAVLLAQLPFWGPLALKARERWGWKVAYDCLDEHAGFPETGRAMLALEAPLMAQSDLVLAAGRALHEKAERAAGRAMLLPNAADFEHFGETQAAPAPFTGPGPVIGYFGALAEWFDVDLVAEAAAARPAWQFVLIGRAGAAEAAGLKGLENVHLLGEQPYAALPAWLRRFDAACIPFRLTPLTRATNPVKFYECLSAGKPVVATALPELEPFTHLHYPARTPDEFVAQLEAALAEHDPALVQARIDFARANTWQARAQTLHEAVTAQYGKVVVVVVSYQQLGYLRQCLESLWARTVYPNLDVIVVDNGSGPEVRAYLQGAAAREPRLRLILNDANLGFARACNQGLQAAGPCAFVAFLNNDTIVTRGWLSGLTRHLADPAVGLAGPVSNWAGNEARITPGYRDLAGLEPFAARLAEQQRGQSFEIPMLALYCAVLRKAVLDEVGLLDERFGLGMFEDDDFSLRLKRAGYRLLCAEDVFVHHWGRASFGQLDAATYDQLFRENRKKFEEKWRIAWQPHRARPE